MFRGFLLLISFLFLSFPIYGFQIDFPKSTFSLGGSGRTRSLLVTNKGTDLLAVEIAVLPREIDMNGEEILGSPSPDFDIYPTQLLIGPGEDANVSLVWKGTSMPSKEVAYRVESKEIPFNDSSKFQSGMVDLLVGRRFLHSAYVTPSGVKSDVRVKSLEPSGNTDLRELVVIIENGGGLHKVISGFYIKVTASIDEKGHVTPLRNEVVVNHPQFEQKINLLSGGSRRWAIPWPENLPKTRLVGTFFHVE